MIASSLGIDFGTSHTVAVLRHDGGGFAPLLFDGSPLLPSAVFAETDGGILTGRDAMHSARVAPERFEPHPKRHVDDSAMQLGDREVPVVELFAAVLARVREECERVAGGIPPRVTITHPAEWGPTRRLVLEDAAHRAGFPQPGLLPEPVAAATYFAHTLRHGVTSGSAVVVYDFGGGTFDASVVVAGEAGFEVRAVEGLDDLGGVDLDEVIVGHFARRFGDDSRWTSLVRPQTAEQRRQHRTFYDDVRAAKERLSRHVNAELSVPLVGTDIHLTRDELETLTRPLLERAVAVTQAVIRASRVPADNITGVFLVGGASRMPLAATMLHHATRIPPTVIDQPEVVVAQGATTPDRSPVAPAQPEPVTPVAPPPPSPVTPPPPTPATAPPALRYPADAALPGPLHGVRSRAWVQAVFGLSFLSFPFIGVRPGLEGQAVWFYLLQLPLTVLPAVLAGAAAFYLGTRRRWVFGLAVGSQLAQPGGVVGWLLLALLLRPAADVQMHGTLVGTAMAVFVCASAIVGVVRVLGRHGRAWWLLPPGPDESGMRPDRPDWLANLRSWLWIQVVSGVPTAGLLFVLAVVDPEAGTMASVLNPFETPAVRWPFAVIAASALIAMVISVVRLRRARVSRPVALFSVYGLALANLYWTVWTILEMQVTAAAYGQTDFPAWVAQFPLFPLVAVGFVFAALSVFRLHARPVRDWFRPAMTS